MMSETDTTDKRINLRLAKDLYIEIFDEAKIDNLNVTSMVVRLLKIGLYIAKTIRAGNEVRIIEKDTKKEKGVMFI